MLKHVYKMPVMQIEKCSFAVGLLRACSMNLSNLSGQGQQFTTPHSLNPLTVLIIGSAQSSLLGLQYHIT